jgi:elongation of very long chain fatty acids protein 4
MYTYYFVTLHTKDVWWKQALTASQMIQFILMNAQALYILFSGCTLFPRKITAAYLYYILSLLFLFANFFIMSYIVKKPKKKGGKKGDADSEQEKEE